MYDRFLFPACAPFSGISKHAAGIGKEVLPPQISEKRKYSKEGKAGLVSLSLAGIEDVYSVSAAQTPAGEKDVLCDSVKIGLTGRFKP